MKLLFFSNTECKNRTTIYFIIHFLQGAQLFHPSGESLPTQTHARTIMLILCQGGKCKIKICFFKVPSFSSQQVNFCLYKYTQGVYTHNLLSSVWHFYITQQKTILLILSEGKIFQMKTCFQTHRGIEVFVNKTLLWCLLYSI